MSRSTISAKTKTINYCSSESSFAEIDRIREMDEKIRLLREIAEREKLEIEKYNKHCQDMKCRMIKIINNSDKYIRFKGHEYIVPKDKQTRNQTFIILNKQNEIGVQLTEDMKYYSLEITVGSKHNYLPIKDIPLHHNVIVIGKKQHANMLITNHVMNR